MNEIDCTKIEKEIETLAEVQASGMTGFQEKFKVRDSLSVVYFQIIRKQSRK